VLEYFPAFRKLPDSIRIVIVIVLVGFTAWLFHYLLAL
jgi:hypothetical protein